MQTAATDFLLLAAAASKLLAASQPPQGPTVPAIVPFYQPSPSAAYVALNRTAEKANPFGAQLV